MDSSGINSICLLPSDLLLLIFQNLPTLDEPLSLAITCKLLYKIFKLYERKIAWSLICSRPHHILDVRLCYLADALHGEVEDITLHIPSVLDGFLDYDSIFAATVESGPIIDRYLRRICLWWKQAGQLRSNFTSHINEYQDALFDDNSYHQPEESYVMACSTDCKPHICRHLPLSNRNESNTVSQEKFYRAVIACTFETKVIQLFAISFELEDEMNPALARRIYADWFECSTYTLQEFFENSEIFDYTSNYLLQNIFNSPPEYQEWENGILGLGDHRNLLLDNWMDFHRCYQKILTPFDILALFIYGMRSDEMRKKSSLYLKNFLSMSSVLDLPREFLHVERDMLRNPSKPMSEASVQRLFHHWWCATRVRIFSNDFEFVDYSVAVHAHDASPTELESGGDEIAGSTMLCCGKRQNRFSANWLDMLQASKPT